MKYTRTLSWLAATALAVTLNILIAPAARAGYALSFNGANNYVNLTLTSPPASNYTISAWVFPRTGGTTSANLGVLSGACGSTIEFLIHSSTANATDPQYLELGRCNFFFGTNSASPVPLNAWTHVAVTVSATKTVSYFINGGPAGTWTNAALDFSLGTNVNLGDNVVRRFNGMLDNVQIWNRTLSQSEIQTYMSNPLTGNESGLYAYYPFDEGSGATTADMAAAHGGSAGALINTPAWVTNTPTVPTGVTAVSWRMGEDDMVGAPGTATTTTDPTGGRTMTLVGGPFYNSAAISPVAAAHTGSHWCMWFFPSTYGTAALIPTLTDNFGIELWVQPNETTAQTCLAYNGNTGTSGWGLYKFGATYQGLFGGVANIGSGPVTANAWTHLALVRNNGTTTLYVNGVAAGSTTAAPIAPTGSFAVAANPQNPANDRFGNNYGYLDEVRVFTFAPGAFSVNDLLLNSAPPTVTALPATGVTATNATLNGTVNPNGLTTAAYFQYGLTTNYGSFSATNTLAATIVNLSVSNLISLSPDTTYHFQLAAVNSAGATLGADQTFTTAAGAPAVTTLAASSITATNATLNGTVNPGGGVTTAYFQYGPTTSYGSFSATNTLAATNGNLSVSDLIGSLSPGTTYHFQLVGINSAGATPGADQTFTTVAFPAVTTLAASSITATNATLNGTVNPGGGVTTAYFQYGLTTSYGSFSATNTLAATNVNLSVSDLIGSLSPVTTYHFQLVGINGAGTTLGADMTVTTAVAAPAVATLGASGITTTSATLNGTVNPGNGPTTAYFQYGLDTNYGSFSATNALAATNLNLSVSNLIGSLSPGNAYHFRLVGINSAGTTLGADQAFTAMPVLPVVATLPASGISATNATLNGTVNPGNGATTAYFQYGLDTNYGNIGSPAGLPATNATLALASAISFLSGPAGTNWTAQTNAPNAYWNSVASSSDGTKLVAVNGGVNNSSGYIYTSTNSGVTWTAQTNAPSTSWYSVASSADGTKLAAVDNSPGLIYTSSGITSNLTPGTTYHYQLVGINSAGITLGADMTFTTMAAQPAAFTLKGAIQLAGGAFQLTFTNLSGLGFTVFASTNVAAPFNTWSNLGPAVESPASSGHYQFTDPGATNKAAKFYRVRSP